MKPYWNILEKQGRYLQVQCSGCARVFRRKEHGIKTGNSTCCLQCSRNSARAIPKHLLWLRIRYSNIKQRCTNPKHPSYHNYGARGITLQFKSCAEFVAYVTQLPGCDKNLELDRIDNNGHYAKGNLRWASDMEQSGNTRKSSKIWWEGKQYSLRAWLRTFTKLAYTTGRQRLRNGSTLEALIG